MSATRTYTVHLEPLANGGYFVTVPALPGCATEGDSYEHALAMAKEAIDAHVAVLVEDGDAIPEEPAPRGESDVGCPSTFQGTLADCVKEIIKQAGLDAAK